MARPLALITGASKGIGEEFARVFAREGWNLVLVARDGERLGALGEALESSHGTQCQIITADLSEAAAAQAVWKALGDRPLEALVNNAGYGVAGAVAAIPLDAELGMFHVNVMSLVVLTKLALPGMIVRKSGRILNVASTAGFQPGPFMAGYYATKACVLSYTEALAEELRGTGVSATCLCPGPTRTDFFRRADLEGVPLSSRLGLSSAQEVAELGYRAMMARKPLAIAGLLNGIAAFSVRFAPRRLVVRAARWLQEKRGAAAH